MEICKCWIDRRDCVYHAAPSAAFTVNPYLTIVHGLCRSASPEVVESRAWNQIPGVIHVAVMGKDGASVSVEAILAIQETLCANAPSDVEFRVTTMFFGRAQGNYFGETTLTWAINRYGSTEWNTWWTAKT